MLLKTVLALHSSASALWMASTKYGIADISLVYSNIMYKLQCNRLYSLLEADTSSYTMVDWVIQRSSPTKGTGITRGAITQSTSV